MPRKQRSRIVDASNDDEEVVTPKAFRFFDLPTELRLLVYRFALYAGPDVIDLEPGNGRRIHSRMTLFRVSRRMHEEAYREFYRMHTFRLYPLHLRYFQAKKPLLTRLPVRYRDAISTIQLKIGQGWSAPPASWNTLPSLGLQDCTSLRMLKILVQCDPSTSYFDGYRGKGRSQVWYIEFCQDLLEGILARVPWLRNVEIDAYPGIGKDSLMVTRLAGVIHKADLRLTYGRQVLLDSLVCDPALLFSKLSISD